MGTHVYVIVGQGGALRGTLLGEWGSLEEAEGVELRHGVR